MTSLAPPANASRSSTIAVTAAELRRGLAWGVAVLLAAVGIVLFARRVSGALAQPLPPLSIVLTGFIGIAAVFAVRRLDRQGPAKIPLSVALGLIAISISLPGSSWLALALLWLAIIGEEIWAWKPRQAAQLGQIDVAWRHAIESPPPPVAMPITGSETAETEKQAELEPELAADWTHSDQLQQLKYSRDATGGLAVEGWLRAEFAPGQRTAIVHAAFCPAFARTPQVESEPLDGPDCEIHPTLTLSWGIRWDVKLSRAATQPTSVVLGFYATEFTDT